MKKTLAGSLIEISRRYRWRLLLVTTVVLFSNILMILNPLIFRQALIEMSSEGFASLSTWTLFSWAALLILITSASAVLKYFSRIVFITIGREVELNLRKKLFNRFQLQSRDFFDQYGIGDLLSRLTNDVAAYRELLGPGMMFPLFFVTLIVPSVIVLFFLSPLLASLSVIPIILIFLFNIVVRGVMYRLSAKVQKFLGEMSVNTHEHYSGIRIVKSYVIESALMRQFREVCRRFKKESRQLAIWQGIVAPVINLITRFITLAIVVVAGVLTLRGIAPFSVADFLSFMWIQSFILGPLMMLGWVFPMYQRGKAAYERLVEIFEAPIQVQDHSTPLTEVPPEATLTLRHLSFSFPHQTQKVLRNINIHIEPKTFIGITGPVGSGKTTLFRLLNREYEVDKGMILLGGRDIHEYPLKSIHKSIGVVEQLPFLFSKSIVDNIRLNNDEISNEQLEQVIRWAELNETLAEFPMRSETVVGERGVLLSGGQKQRIAIARTLLLDHPILLLDDIFSALDAETEVHVFDALRHHFKNKTVLLITHRIRVLEKMDQVIYLKEGQVIEQGSPSELASHEGVYQAMMKLQSIDLS